MNPSRFRLSLLVLLVVSFCGTTTALADADSERTRGIELYKAKNYKAAAGHLSKAIKDGDESPECYLYLAGAHYGYGNHRKAINWYLETAERFDGEPAGDRARNILKRLDPKGLWARRRARMKGSSRRNSMTEGEPSHEGFVADELAGKYRDKRIVLSDAEYKQEYEAIPQESRVQVRYRHGRVTLQASVNGNNLYFRYGKKWESLVSLKDLEQIKMKPPAGEPYETDTEKKTGQPNRKWRTALTIKIGSITRKIPVTVCTFHSGYPELGHAFWEDLRIGGRSSSELTISKKSRQAKGVTAKIGEYKKEFGDLPDKAEFPFRRGSQGHMHVTAYINDRPIRCMFDTGASGFFGLHSCPQAGIKPPKPNEKPDGMTSGWAGRPVPVWDREAKVRIGNLTRVIPIRVSPSWTQMPLLGQEFIRDYHYSIDLKANRMVLTKKTAKSAKAKRPINKLYDVPCIVEDDREFVSLKINGCSVSRVLVDTGASGTIISSRAARAAHLSIPAGARTVYISGVGGMIPLRKVYVDIELGPIRRHGFPILVGGRTGSAIGQDLLSGHRFTVDREEKLLRFFH